MAAHYYIALTLLLFSAANGVNSGSCPFDVQDGCSCSTQESGNSVTCTFNDTSTTTGPMITSSLNESIGLHVVNISNNNLTGLSPDFFNAIESISYLDLSGNRFINTMSGSVKNVSTINLSHNELSKLVMVDLAEMTTLKNLDISFNQISQVIVDETFAFQFNVLNISHNVLQSVPVALWKLPVTMDLSHNQLDLKLGFPECQLKNLYLTGNRISSVPSGAFLQVPTLETLHLDDNQLVDIDNKSFLGALSLTEINLEHNILSNVRPGTFRQLPNIATIKLGSNKIPKIESEVFIGLEDSLTRLSLAGNQISFIHPQAFSTLENLRALDLSANPALTEVTRVRFPPHIAHLDLSNCSVRSVPDCVFAAHRDLVFLSLAGNDLNCSCHLTWLLQRQTAKRMSVYASEVESAPQWRCLDSDRRLIEVSSDPSPCNLTSHVAHCQGHTVPVDPNSVSMNITVELGNTVIAKWSLKSKALVYGFVVSYDSKDADRFVSPVLGNMVNQYEMKDVKVSDAYVLCVSVLLNETYTIKKVCHAESSYILQMIIGILAGVVFLIPCIIALSYILYKDYKVMQSTYDYIYDTENPVEDSKQEVKGDKVNVIQVLTVKGQGHEVVPLGQMQASHKKSMDSPKQGKGGIPMSNPAFVPDCGASNTAVGDCGTTITTGRDKCQPTSTESVNTKL